MFRFVVAFNAQSRCRLFRNSYSLCSGFRTHAPVASACDSASKIHRISSVNAKKSWRRCIWNDFLSANAARTNWIPVRYKSTETNFRGKSPTPTIRDNGSKDRDAARKVRSRSLVLYLMSLGLAMFALAFASAPLYSVFCRVSGMGGNSRLAKLNEAAQREAEAKMKHMRPLRSRKIRVRFEADVDTSAYWQFAPVVREVSVYPGEPTLAFFTATNPTDADAIGIATYTILPYEAAQYFIKIQCFCFDEQRIGAHETVQLPVLFYVDTDYDTDPRLEFIDDIVLSYTFLESKDAEELLAAGTDLRLPHPPPMKSNVVIPASTDGAAQPADSATADIQSQKETLPTESASIAQ